MTPSPDGHFLWDGTAWLPRGHMLGRRREAGSTFVARHADAVAVTVCSGLALLVVLAGNLVAPAWKVAVEGLATLPILRYQAVRSRLRDGPARTRWYAGLETEDGRFAWDGAEWHAVPRGHGHGHGEAGQPTPWVARHAGPVAVVACSGAAAIALVAAGQVAVAARPVVEAVAVLPIVWIHSVEASLEQGRLVLRSPFAAARSGPRTAAAADRLRTAVVWGGLLGILDNVVALTLFSSANTNVAGLALVILNVGIAAAIGLRSSRGVLDVVVMAATAGVFYAYGSLVALLLGSYGGSPGGQVGIVALLPVLTVISVVSWVVIALVGYLPARLLRWRRAPRPT